MNVWGWIFMLTSWAIILSVFTFCLIKTLRQNGNAGTVDAEEA